MIFGGAMLMTASGRTYHSRRARECFSYIARGLPAIHQATYFLRTALPTEPYDVSYRVCGDYALVATLVASSPSVAYVEGSLALFDTSGVSSRHPATLLSESMRVRRDILHLSWLRCVSLTARVAVRWALSRIAATTICAHRSSSSGHTRSC
jgi:putative colanic acid biosynthesis glycosyltransferase